MTMNLRHLTICVNNTCNMNCSYCFRKKEIIKNEEFTDWTNLVAFLAWSQDINIDPYKLHVMFTGGEPTLNISNIINGVNAIKNFSNKTVELKFGITSNLTNPSVLLYLISRNILDIDGVAISWDGIYKKYLIDEFDDKIKSYYNNEEYYRKVLIKIAISKEMYNHSTLYENLVYLRDLGFTNISYYFVNGTDDYNDRDIRDCFKVDLDILLKDDWVIKIVNNFKELNNYFLLKGNGKYYYNDYKDTYCNKLGHLLYIDTNGDIWPCALYSNESKVHNIENIDEYKLGNIRDRKINSLIFNKLECNKYYNAENMFCHACDEKCKESIIKMKQIELNVFKDHYNCQ